jgi:hypothetical protein
VTTTADVASCFGRGVVEPSQSLLRFAKRELHADEEVAAFSEGSFEQGGGILRAYPMRDVHQHGAVAGDRKAGSVNSKSHAAGTSQGAPPPLG